MPHPYNDAIDALHHVVQWLDNVDKDGVFPNDSITPWIEDTLVIRTWIDQCCTVEEGDRIARHYPPLSDGTAVLRGNHDLDDWIKQCRKWIKQVIRLLNTIPPKIFKRHGLKVLNNDGLSESIVSDLLEGVDYLVAKFKQRGMEKLLSAGIRYIELMKRPQGGGDAHGHYWSDGHISLYHIILTSGFEGRLTKQWVNEVFVHEFGHFVHLRLLSPDAKAYWDSPWDDIESAKEQHKKENQERFGYLTAKDREEFWTLLVRNGYSITAAAKSIREPYRVIKFGYWLRNPGVNGPLITAKQFRLTPEGKKTFETLRGGFPLYSQTQYGKVLQPGDTDYEDAESAYSTWLNRKKSLVFMLGDDMSIPIPNDIALEIAEAFPGKGFNVIVHKLKESLDLVSDYAGTNNKEDFAETFTAWFEQSESLTPTAKFRMLRTLSLSGLYGRSIARIAVQAVL